MGNINKKDFFPIVLGSDENAYGTARLFYEEYGVKPLLMCTRRLYPTYYSNLFTLKQVDNLDSKDVFVDALLSQLKELKTQYDNLLVVPCSDYYCELLVANYDKFEGLIANKFISQELLSTFYSKDKFYELCEKHGMDYPKTYVATPQDRISAIDKLPFDFPICVKPDNSNSYEYLHAEFEGKKKVYFFFDKPSYIKLMKSMNKSDYKGNLIIQEFIPGGDDTGRVVNSYSGNDTVVRATCLGQPVIEEYAPKTLGNYAAIITRSDAALYKKVEKFLHDIGYVGFSNIDMKYDARTGKYLLFEINPRLGRSSFFVYGSGINMMKMLVDDVVYDKEWPCIHGEKTSLWLNVPKAVISEYVSSEELKKEALQLIKNKKSFRTLLWGQDRNLKRNIYMKRYYMLQHNNFKNYYFKKNEFGL